MSTPSEPAGWSRAELETLRAVALAATPGEWRQGKMGDPVGGRHVVDLGEPPKAPFVTFTKGHPGNETLNPWPAAAIVHSDLDNTPNDAAHIATFDPPTALKLIDAIMALAPPSSLDGGGAEALTAVKGKLASMLADGLKGRHHDVWQRAENSGISIAIRVIEAALAAAPLPVGPKP